MSEASRGLHVRRLRWEVVLTVLGLGLLGILIPVVRIYLADDVAVATSVVESDFKPDLELPRYFLPFTNTPLEVRMDCPTDFPVTARSVFSGKSGERIRGAVLPLVPDVVCACAPVAHIRNAALFRVSVTYEPDAARIDLNKITPLESPTGNFDLAKLDACVAKRLEKAVTSRWHLGSCLDRNAVGGKIFITLRCRVLPAAQSRPHGPD